MKKKMTRKEKYILDAMNGIDGVKLTREEAEDRYEFDFGGWCDSDELCEEYLRNHCTCAVVEEKEVDEMFYKGARVKAKMTTKEQKANKQLSVADRDNKMGALVEGMKQYPWLFPTDMEVTDKQIEFKDPETGKMVTIKFSKHKTQKVVTKEVKRKDPTAPFTTYELRQMAIQNIMLNNTDIFEAPSFAGASFGGVLQDKKYPFYSFRITNHKE